MCLKGEKEIMEGNVRSTKVRTTKGRKKKKRERENKLKTMLKCFSNNLGMD